MGSVSDADRQALPECRIPATVNPAGFLRFEVSEQQAHDIFDRLQTAYETGEDNELVPVRFVLDTVAREAVADGLQELQTGLPRVGQVHVMLSSEPDYAFTVLLSAAQVGEVLDAASVDESEVVVSKDGDGGAELYTQEFRVTRNAAVVTIRQMEHAFDGVDDPVDAIDFEEIRNSVP